MTIKVSLAGLDLSFMYNSPDVAPTPRKPVAPPKRGTVAAPYFMGDIKEFQSPIDGDMISSRAKLRRHERTHNVRQCGDYRPGQVIAEQDKRIATERAGADANLVKWTDAD